MLGVHELDSCQVDLDRLAGRQPQDQIPDQYHHSPDTDGPLLLPLSLGT